METPTVELTDRDLALMQTLFETRIMTLNHAATLHFEGRYEAAKQRVGKLKRAGLIGERPRRPYHPAVLFLTKAAFTLMEERGLLNDYPQLIWTDLQKRARVSEMTVKHELAVMDVRCAITAALAKLPKYRLIDFSTWPLRHSFHAKPTPMTPDMLVRPDGYLRILENGENQESFEHACFMELDRSTEVLQTLVTRAMCYRQFYSTGGLARWNGRPGDDFKDFPFRVLVVVQNAERMNNLAIHLLLLKPPILSQVWIGVMNEVIADPLGAVWITPGDYRKVVSGTPFDLPAALTETVYRRRTDREEFITKTIPKRMLLTG